MFDAKQYLDSFEAPLFVDPDGQEHRGILLSHQQWLPLQKHLNALANINTLTIDSLHEAIRLIINAIFPRPWWKFWSPRVSSYVMALPPTGQLKALWSFLEPQESLLGIEVTKTPGVSRLLETGAEAPSDEPQPATK